MNLRMDVRFTEKRMPSADTNLSRFMRKPDFCICENKGADQLGGYQLGADQSLCVRNKDVYVIM